MSKISNREFDKKVRELMEEHRELPDVGSWSLIESSLSRNKKAKVLYFRRSLYAAVAVAASLVLLLMLNRSSYDFNDSIKVVVQKEAIANLEKEQTVEETLQPIKEPRQSSKVEEVVKILGQIKLEEKIALEKQTVIEDRATIEEKKTVQEQASQSVKHFEQEKSASDSKRDFRYPKVEDYKSVSKKRGPLLVAFATNLSPSTRNNSVSLMAMSQAQGGFAPNDVVSTVQKASVPQEVISDTKFLMPVSFGVQAQMPISKLLSVGMGVNYTMLFFNYDARSRQEAKQTQQTLHYIGVPVNLYINIMQKDNLRLYATGGITLEKGLYAFHRVFENGVRRSHGESIEGLQWSVSGGFGVEFFVNNSTGLYFDPTIAYYFDNNQPLSIRTSQPLQFNFELGFRFHL
ncbi:MAG: outer membrane beta-barrel protein [Bacteroidales bacterium]